MHFKVAAKVAEFLTYLLHIFLLDPLGIQNQKGDWEAENLWRQRSYNTCPSKCFRGSRFFGARRVRKTI